MKPFTGFICFVGVLLLLILALHSCDQTIARNYGGTMTVNVKPGYKVTEATWKDEDELWYLIEPMDSTDTPKDKEFIEDSRYGVLEGKVIFHESKK